jgi:ketosteroid isomerase-like protein
MSSVATDISPERTTRGATAAQGRSAEEWVREFTEGWREPRGADGFIAHFREILGEDIRLVQPQLGTVVGRKAFEERFVRPLFALIPDLHAEVERWAVNGDDALIELTLRGTVCGRPVAWRACDRITLRDGVAVERETYCDPLPLIAAIARVPRAWPQFVRLRVKSRAGARRERRKAS